MSRHRRKSNHNNQYGQDSWDGEFGNNYWSNSFEVDPETYIRYCEDKLEEAYGFLERFQSERAKAIRHNTWYSIKYVISIIVFGGPFVVMGVQFYTGHWFWGIVTFLGYCFVFDILRILEKEFVDNDHKEDTTFFDNDIREVKTIIERLKREMEIARTVAQRQNSNSSYTDYEQTSHNAGNVMECYRVLGCSPESSNEELKKKYHELIRELHPDKVRGTGNSNYLVNLAEEQVKKINEAYDIIKKTRGIN